MDICDERAFAIAKALLKLDEIYNDMRLQKQILLESSVLEVAHVCLIDANNVCTTLGSGKGKNYKIGAYAEAFEHHVLSLEAKFNTFQNRSLEQLRTQDNAHRIPLLQMFDQSEAEYLDIVEFKKYNTKKIINLPVVLVNPNYQSEFKTFIYKKYKQYATNSGAAFGCNFEEAILHGVNEVIERDYLSDLFCHLIGYKVINPGFYQLGIENINYSQQTKMTHVLPFKLIWGSYKNRLFFVAAIQSESNESHPMSLIGSGCSWNFETALNRAIDEFCQIVFLYSDDTDEYYTDESVASKFRKNDKLRPLMYPVIDQFNFMTPEPQKTYDFEDQLKLIQQFDFYYRTIFEHANGACVSQVFVPQANRFNLIRSGSFVAPFF